MARRAEMETTSSPLVTIDEVSARLGMTPEMAMGIAGDEVEFDWAGRPAVGIEIAARMVSGQTLERESAVRKQAAYDSAMRGYVAEREVVRQEAEARFTEQASKRQRERLSLGYAHLEFPADLSLGGSERTWVAEKVAEAVHTWERAHPLEGE